MNRINYLIKKEIREIKKNNKIFNINRNRYRFINNYY